MKNYFICKLIPIFLLYYRDIYITTFYLSFSIFRYIYITQDMRKFTKNFTFRWPQNWSKIFLRHIYLPPGCIFSSFSQNIWKKRVHLKTSSSHIFVSRCKPPVTDHYRDPFFLFNFEFWGKISLTRCRFGNELAERCFFKIQN